MKTNNNKLLKKYSKYLLNIVPKLIKRIFILNNEIIIYVPFNYIYQTIFFLKNHTYSTFKSLSDLCAVDFPNRTWRFEIVYNLLSIDHNSRIRVKTKIDEINYLQSISSIHNSANWYEREVWDLFGIFFENHPDLRRILTDYGFDGFPLRKDFPLSGYIEVRYSEKHKRVISEPIQLAQEYRYFNFKTTVPIKSNMKFKQI